MPAIIGPIRAEAVSSDDLARPGGEASRREAGKRRLGGKDCVAQDGDLIHFRFAI